MAVSLSYGQFLIAIWYAVHVIDFRETFMDAENIFNN
jgi:hypothetical protein